MKEYLALFDLDGTLFDTGNVNYCSYRDALRPYGIELDRTYFVEKCNGRHYTVFLPEIMGNKTHMEEVHDAKKKAYAGNLNMARVNTHLVNLIRSMKGAYYTAIVTTASRKNTEDILAHFGLMDLFNHIITQEDVEKSKPDPRCFEMAMEYFGISADKTLIFEDSDVGIQAAEKSGATVFVVDKF